MNKILTLAFVAPLALAAGCGSDAKSCTITTTGGVQSLTCPDGTSSTLGGTSGAAGVSSLAVVADEPAGTNCPNGGKSITTGIDTNGDGTLQPSEVKSTSYVCNPSAPVNPIVLGDVTITNSAQIAQLAGVTSISGTLLIETDGLTSLSLPSLQHAASFIVQSGDALTSVSAPALQTVDNQFVLTGAALATADFGALTSTSATPGEGNSVFRIFGTALADLKTFAKLTVAGDQIVVDSNTALTSLAGFADQLKTSLNIEIDDNAVLTSVAFPVATSFGFLEVESNALLTTLSFPALTDPTHYDFYPSNNPLLTTCTFGTTMSCADTD